MFEAAEKNLEKQKALNNGVEKKKMSEKERNNAKKSEDTPRQSSGQEGKLGHGKRILLRTFGWPMADL